MVGQGPDVLQQVRDGGLFFCLFVCLFVCCCFFYYLFVVVVFCFVFFLFVFFFSSGLSYLFLMPHLLGDGWTY